MCNFVLSFDLILLWHNCKHASLQIDCVMWMNRPTRFHFQLLWNFIMYSIDIDMYMILKNEIAKNKKHKIWVYFRRPDTTIKKKSNQIKMREKKKLRILSHPQFIFIVINRIRVVWIRLCWLKIFHENTLNHFDWKIDANAIETSNWNSWTTRCVVSIRRKKTSTICHGKFPIVNVWLIGWLLMFVS